MIFTSASCVHIVLSNVYIFSQILLFIAHSFQRVWFFTVIVPRCIYYRCDLAKFVLLQPVLALLLSCRVNRRLCA